MGSKIDYVELFGESITKMLSSYTSLEQVESEIKDHLSKLTDTLNADFSLTTITQFSVEGEEEIFCHSYGMSPEHTKQLVNVIRKSDHFQNMGKNPGFSNYILVNPMETHHSGRMEMFGTKQLVIIPQMRGNKRTSFYLFFTDRTNLTLDQIKRIQLVIEILVQILETHIELESLNQQRIMAREYFYQHYDPTIILSEELLVTDINAEAALVIGSSGLIGQHIKGILPIREGLNELLELIKSIEIDERSRKIEVDWDISNNNLIEGDNISIEIGVRKIQSIEGSLEYILSGRIKDNIEISGKKSIHLPQGGEILPQLPQYPQYLEKNPDEAIQFGLENLFPASFVVTANEMTGPVIVASSPKDYSYEAGEGAIKLMAGLDTTQIVEQGYITGNIPWSIPKGEMQWIAFTRDNPGARGNVEIHCLGIITKRNLMLAIPTFNHAILGILLGGMNTYNNILSEDDVDFTTTPFYQDRNFSTLSLVQKGLEEIRVISCEVLAAAINQKY